jgi:L-methionine (R)-S-oxide reductase
MLENTTDYRSLEAEEFWSLLSKDLDLLISQEDATITTLANSASFLYGALDRINWVGYYLFDGERLVLGPFCGKPACTTIPIGKGVCGTAAERREMVVVEDVLKFPGHIACDAASRSEIVFPLIINGTLLGVLDIDSPVESRFQPGDISGLKKMTEIITSKIVRPTVLM